MKKVANNKNSASTKGDIELLKREMRMLASGMNKVGTGVEKMNSRMDKMDSRVGSLEWSVSKLISELKTYRNEFIEFKDRVYTNLDWLVGEYKKSGEEDTFLTNRQSKHADILVNHESRIKRLEKTHAVSL